MSHIVSTAQVDASQRVAYWTDLVCDTYVQLGCDPCRRRWDRRRDRRRFAGHAAASRVTATGQIVRRTRLECPRQRTTSW
jgi:hypothetical protein